MDCNFHLTWLPIDPLNNSLGVDSHVSTSNALSESVKQIFVSIAGSERAMALNLFLRTHAANQPMRADQPRIGGVETAHVCDGASLGFLKFLLMIRIRKAAFEESQE